ncbi:MAG TPA: gliding motility-associated C-terminal domain-containing protein [Flavobacteriales bacterium]
MVTTLSGQAQLQHANWLFGNDAGLSFTGGAPVAITGVSISSFEGCTSISDEAGQLLFYTEGTHVLDRTGAVMPNGSGMAGDASSCQGVLIVPMPGGPGQYYLFTVPAQIGLSGVADHMTWSVIDMGLNGGYGDVTLKNIPLVTHPTEQLAATYHTNGVDVWVLTRLFGSDAWYAYLVDCQDISAPVISHAGRVVQDSNPLDTQAALGWMDISADGTRIASTWNDYSGQTSYLELLSFDATSGGVSNGTHTTHPSPNGSNTAYGVCFSPNDHVLYWSEYGAYNRLWQFDLDAADPFATGQMVGQSNSIIGGMQTGLDGRLYLARWDGSQYLGVVNAPDVVGAGCDFVLDGVDIAPGYGSLALSNDWMHPRAVIDLIAWTDTTTCTDELRLALTYPFTPPGPDTWWSTGSSGPTCTVEASGTYTVRVVLGCDTLHDTVHVVMPGPPVSNALPDSLTICIGEEAVLQAPPGFVSYLWSTGDTGPGTHVRQGGTGWLEMRDASGCVQRDTFTVALGPCRCTLHVPNAFTPNGDGINDLFQAVTTCAPDDLELLLFDRWGAEIHRIHGTGPAWDGTGAPEGLYIWRAWSTRWNGPLSEEHVQYGTVALLP